MSISDWSSDVCSSDLRPVITYGFSDDADLHACDVRPKGSGAHFTVCFDDGKPEARREAFHLNLPGEHNVQNALAAIAIGRELGVAFDAMRRALSGFGGDRQGGVSGKSVSVSVDPGGLRKTKKKKNIKTT